MASTTQKLMERGLIGDAPPFLKTNVHYETIMGSHAYGVADTSVQDKIPDYDIYGWAIPPKAMVFKHLTGWVPGFGPEPPGFDQFQRHHIFDQDATGGKGKNRRQFKKMLKRVAEDDVARVVIEYKDRIARYGFETFKSYCESYGVEVVVLKDAEKKEFEEEMVEDIIALVTSYSARIYGKRGGRKKEKND